MVRIILFVWESSDIFGGILRYFWWNFWQYLVEFSELIIQNRAKQNKVKDGIT
jgi:hypothetical protein